MDTALSVFVLLSVVLAMLAVYLTPAVIAFVRRHPDRWSIAVFDLLLGWMVVTWVLALCWSLTGFEFNRKGG
jgi:predicted membrane channel-forming protein YqfA (hemolysin III family)